MLWDRNARSVSLGFMERHVSHAFVNMAFVVMGPMALAIVFLVLAEETLVEWTVTTANKKITDYIVNTIVIVTGIKLNLVMMESVGMVPVIVSLMLQVLSVVNVCQDLRDPVVKNVLRITTDQLVCCACAMFLEVHAMMDRTAAVIAIIAIETTTQEVLVMIASMVVLVTFARIVRVFLAMGLVTTVEMALGLVIVTVYSLAKLVLPVPTNHIEQVTTVSNVSLDTTDQHVRFLFVYSTNTVVNFFQALHVLATMGNVMMVLMVAVNATVDLSGKENIVVVCLSG
eukprot:m.151851 g.151851  ORF g.151851 m.151851 type:complete len:285 (+) comp15046_c0_seq1:55-909(+)